MTNFNARTIALVGLGLISGSLARALQASHWDGRLIAWGPREPSLKRGLELGVIDDYSLDLNDIVAQADIIVIGAPPIATGKMISELTSLVSGAEKQPIITDLASIKGYVVDAASADYPFFVPGHPIAGQSTAVLSTRTQPCLKAEKSFSRLLITLIPAQLRQSQPCGR